MPGSLAIISASFAEDERGRAIGTWAGFTAITSAVGPVLGGWLIDNLSWRWIFFINIPLAIVVLVVTFWHVPESRDQDAARLDWWGALLVVIGLGSLIFGLIESSSAGFGDPLVIISLAIAVVSIPVFLLVETRVDEPMLPLELFRSRTFSGANLLCLFLYGALGGALFFLPLNLIQVQGYSATAAGAAFLPFIVIMFVLSRWSGGLVTSYGPKLPLIVGPIIAGIGLAAFAIPGVGGSYWTTFFLPAAALGLGMAISVAPLTTTVMNSVEDRFAGIASGINNADTRVASLLAVAIFGIVVFSTFSAALNDQLDTIDMPEETRQILEDRAVNLAAMEIPPSVDEDTAAQVQTAINESFVTSFRLVMLISAGLALASALVAAWMIEGPGLREVYARMKPDVRAIVEAKPQSSKQRS